MTAEPTSLSADVNGAAADKQKLAKANLIDRFRKSPGRNLLIIGSLVLSVVLALLSLLVATSSDPSDPTQTIRFQWIADFLLNVGAGFGVSALIFYLFDRIYPTLDPQRQLRPQTYLVMKSLLDDHLPETKEVIRIVDNWSPLLSEDVYDNEKKTTYYERFQAILEKLNEQCKDQNRKIRVEVLMLHPKSIAATSRHEQRLAEDSTFDAKYQMIDSIRKLRWMSKRKFTHLDWQIRISKVPLLIDFYAVDKQGVFGFYPPTKAARNNKHLWFPVDDGKVGDHIMAHYEEVRDDKQHSEKTGSTPVISLDAYWRVKLRLRASTIDVEFDPKYIYFQEHCFIVLDEFLGHRYTKFPKLTPWVKELLPRKGSGDYEYRLTFKGMDPDDTTCPHDLIENSIFRSSEGDIRRSIRSKYDLGDTDSAACNHIVVVKVPQIDGNTELKVTMLMDNPGLDRTYLIDELLITTQDFPRVHQD